VARQESAAIASVQRIPAVDSAAIALMPCMSAVATTVIASGQSRTTFLRL